MDTMAWFRDYLQVHAPGGRWSPAADAAVRLCISLHRRTADAAARQYVIDWADSLISADACAPDCGKALFFALEAAGEEKYREAAEGVMAAIGREPLDVIDSAETLYRVLPFRMAYEMRLGGMEKVGLVAAKFRAAHAALWDAQSGSYGGDMRGTAYALQALVDAIDSCADQLYEHWRALVDMYREVLRGALAAEQPEGECAAMIVWALLAGVRMNLIDPERYLPIARRRIASIREQGMKQAAAMLEMEGDAL